MAQIKNNTVTLQNILDQPIAYLYVFRDFYIDEAKTVKFLNTLGNKKSIINGKGNNQEALIRNTVVSERGNDDTYQEFLGELRNKIKEEYGMSPELILCKLANGETVAGKNWEKGVYGIGENENVAPAGCSVDPTTGKVKYNGTIVKTQYPVYGNITRNGMTTVGVIGYTAEQNNTTITSGVSNTGSYKIYSVGTNDSQKFANGTKFNNADSFSLWASLGTYLPYIGMILSILSGLVSLFKGTSSWSWGNTGLLGAYNTYPCQKDWADFGDDDEGMTTSDLLLLAAAAGAIYLIASSDEETE